MKHDPQAIMALKSRLNIADIVRRYVDLRPAGGRLMGLCPFHSEKTGSFSVVPDKGFFHCFGCQASGDVIDFFCRINGLDFREGLEQLAVEAGVTLSEFKPDPEAEKRRRLRQAASQMHALARDFFRECLAGPDGRAARAYLAKRGVSPDMAESFQLGFSPPDWHALEGFLKARGYEARDAVAAGLLSQGDNGRMWDRFRERLIFPIHDVSGKVVAFGGRVMGPGEPKYLNSADSPVYKKGEHLYGLHQARGHIAKSKTALLTEGYLDVISLHQYGFPEACGVLGTALTPQQVKRLTGFCQRLTLVFDGDEAGEKAALRSARMLLIQGAACDVVLLPQGEDVDSLLHDQGPEAFRACLDHVQDGLDFCLSLVRRNGSAKEVLDWALSFLREMAVDGLSSAYLSRLAHGLGLAEQELRTLAASGQERREPAALPSSVPVLTGPAKEDARILEFAIRYPAYVAKLADMGLAKVLSTDRAKEFWRILVSHGQSDVLVYLDDRQKNFWTRCAAESALSEEEVQGWWQGICRYVSDFGLHARKRELIEAMRQASVRGDVLEHQRLFEVLKDLISSGGSSEQH